MDQNGQVRGRVLLIDAVNEIDHGLRLDRAHLVGPLFVVVVFDHHLYLLELGKKLELVPDSL